LHGPHSLAGASGVVAALWGVRPEITHGRRYVTAPRWHWRAIGALHVGIADFIFPKLESEIKFELLLDLVRIFDAPTRRGLAHWRERYDIPEMA
jgi:hypothetical protein